MAYTPNLPPSRRLLLALSASLLLHATSIALLEWLGLASQPPKPARPAVLHATLLTRPAPITEPQPMSRTAANEYLVPCCRTGNRACGSDGGPEREKTQASATCRS